MRKRSHAPWLAVAVATVAFAVPAAAQKAKDELRPIWRNVVPNVDSYYNGQRDGIVFAHHVWDHLIERDPDTFTYKPGLATEWKWVDEKTLDVQLRQDVKFHDGSAFGAEDVAHTFNFVADPANKALYQRNTNWIRTVEILDGYKVRIHLHRPSRRPSTTCPWRCSSIPGTTRARKR